MALRWGRTNYLSEDLLLLAVKKLKSESIGDEPRDTIKGLRALVGLNTQRLKELRKALGDALEKAPRVESKGELIFAAVAERAKDLASREILEALVRYAWNHELAAVAELAKDLASREILEALVRYAWNQAHGGHVV